MRAEARRKKPEYFFDEFTEAYLKAALWTGQDEHGQPLDKSKKISDFAPQTLVFMQREANRFLELARKLILDETPRDRSESLLERAGHDFWFTRNETGSGFDDGDWPKHGDELATISHDFIQVDLYVGDDGKIYALGHEAGEANEMEANDFPDQISAIKSAKKNLGVTHYTFRRSQDPVVYGLDPKGEWWLEWPIFYRSGKFHVPVQGHKATATSRTIAGQLPEDARPISEAAKHIEGIHRVMRGEPIAEETSPQAGEREIVRYRFEDEHEWHRCSLASFRRHNEGLLDDEDLAVLRSGGRVWYGGGAQPRGFVELVTSSSMPGFPQGGEPLTSDEARRRYTLPHPPDTSPDRPGSTFYPQATFFPGWDDDAVLRKITDRQTEIDPESAEWDALRKKAFAYVKSKGAKPPFYARPGSPEAGETPQGGEPLTANEDRGGTVVVTRHKALAKYLVEQGIISKDAHVIEHATPDDVRGRHVIGVLPLPLAALAASVTEVPIDIPAELRGKELTLAQVRKYARPPQLFRCEGVNKCEVCGHILDAAGLNKWGNPNCAGGRPHRIAGSPRGGEPLPVGQGSGDGPAVPGASEIPVADAVPWVKIARDPELYAQGMARAKEIGPIDDARKIYDLLAPALSREVVEVFIVVLCDLRSNCIGVAETHRGEKSRVSVSRANILQAVTLAGADHFMVVHNHPSGDPTPSQADKKLTNAIMAGAEEVEIPCVDHVVIGMGKYYSFAKGKVISV